jgi:hypothetical protein
MEWNIHVAYLPRVPTAGVHAVLINVMRGIIWEQSCDVRFPFIFSAADFDPRGHRQRPY